MDIECNELGFLNKSWIYTSSFQICDALTFLHRFFIDFVHCYLG